LCSLGFKTQGYISTISDYEYGNPWNNILEKYYYDFYKRRDDIWMTSSLIFLCTTDSIISDAINQIDTAMHRVNWAIREKDKAIRHHYFPEHLSAYSVLYSNRGTLYTKKGEYREALLDFTKAIEFNSLDPEFYFYRGYVYLILEKYSEALADYQQAILIDPFNSKYYRQRALAYTIMGSIDKAKQDLILVEEQNNKLKSYQNELGLHEFSKGSFEKSIDHFD
jgi:tetratricopeptide (TPR) repeat protein